MANLWIQTCPLKSLTEPNQRKILQGLLQAFNVPGWDTNNLVDLKRAFSEYMPTLKGLHGYVFDTVLAAGTTSYVVKVIDQQSGQSRIIKFIHPQHEQKGVHAPETEFQMGKIFAKEGVGVQYHGQLYHVGLNEGKMYYMIQDYVPYRLQDYIACLADPNTTNDSVFEERLIQLVNATMDLFNRIHEKGLTHGDFTVYNIMIGIDQGATPYLTTIDHGFSVNHFSDKRWDAFQLIRSSMEYYEGNYAKLKKGVGIVKKKQRMNEWISRISDACRQMAGFDLNINVKEGISPERNRYMEVRQANMPAFSGQRSHRPQFPSIQSLSRSKSHSSSSSSGRRRRVNQQVIPYVSPYTFESLQNKNVTSVSSHHNMQFPAIQSLSRSQSRHSSSSSGRRRRLNQQVIPYVPPPTFQMDPVNRDVISVHSSSRPWNGNGDVPIQKSPSRRRDKEYPIEWWLADANKHTKHKSHDNKRMLKDWWLEDADKKLKHKGLLTKKLKVDWWLQNLREIQTHYGLERTLEAVNSFFDEYKVAPALRHIHSAEQLIDQLKPIVANLRKGKEEASRRNLHILKLILDTCRFADSPGYSGVVENYYEDNSLRNLDKDSTRYKQLFNLLHDMSYYRHLIVLHPEEAVKLSCNEIIEGFMEHEAKIKTKTGKIPRERRVAMQYMIHRLKEICGLNQKHGAQPINIFRRPISRKTLPLAKWKENLVKMYRRVPREQDKHCIENTINWINHQQTLQPAKQKPKPKSRSKTKRVASSSRSFTGDSFDSSIEGFQYTKRIPLSTKHDVTEIVFNVSRYGKHRSSIKWTNPTSEVAAVAAVEKYLSEPLDKAFFEKVIDDSLDRNLTWAAAQNMYSCRGDMLSDATVLEALDRNGTTVRIVTGS